MVGLTDEQIVEGLRRRDSLVTRDYFYGYCRIAWHIYNRHYGLDHKPGLDFYGIAHEYYLSLSRHGFKPLEDRRPGVSLKTWMVNGFRFVLLDRLKEYQREFRRQSLEERIMTSSPCFDVPDDNFQEDFRNTVMEICHDIYGRDSRSSIILQMMLIDGFKGMEVAAELGVSPSAVAQRFHKIMDGVVVPYFRRYYERPGMLLALEESSVGSIETTKMHFVYQHESRPVTSWSRITPDRVEHLQPNEIFVFGSNLEGLHGGGAARMAHLRFGARMGHGDGLQGQSYAIPTMQGGLDTIQPYVDRFIQYAVGHPGHTFLVTPIGCGIAGFYPEDIAPLFREATGVGNIHLPSSFWKQLL